MVQQGAEVTNEFIPGPEHAIGSAQHYSNMRKVSIFGGSNEIQHNIVAKMVLGL
jgi:alkylation response protein AidB-like acyl-CoA dehydrogenase